MFQGHPARPYNTLVAIFATIMLFIIFLGGTSVAIEDKQYVEIVSDAVVKSQSFEHSVTLPYVLTRQEFEHEGSLVSFIINLSMEKAPETDVGIFIEKVSLSGHVSVNGHSLGNCRIAPVEKLRCLHQPQFFLASKTMWQAGRNQIRIDVFANKNQPNGLSRLIIGDDSYIYSEFYRPAKFWSYDTIIAMQWMMLLLGLGLFLIGFVTKSSLYILFGISSILYSLSSLNSVMEQIYVSEAFASWFIYSVRMSSIAFLLTAMLQFFGIRKSGLRTVLISVAILFPLLVALSWNDRNIVIALYAPLFALALIVVLLVIKATHNAPSARNLFFCGTFIACFMAGPFDYLVLQGNTSFEQRYMIVYTNSFLLFALGGLLVKDLAAAHIAAQNANITLRAALRKQEEELVSTHQQVLELERINTRVQEREHLLREVHDGFGTTLSAAYVRLMDGGLTSAETQALIADCIADLRIVLSVTDPYATFQDAIAELRARAQAIVNVQSIELVWDVRAERTPNLPTSQMLDIVRIIQESLSNAIRHSHASRIQIRCVYADDQHKLEVGIRDNGTGFDKVNATSGRGIRNMERRAAILGGKFEIRRLDVGTEVSLCMVFDRGENAPEETKRDEVGDPSR